MIKIIDIKLKIIVCGLTAEFAKSTINWKIKSCEQYFDIKLADFKYLRI